ncbi:hypothetical protein TUM20985_44170 [Mycobacterium antarcticum]|nr:hypothetical protein TUM20985_44170 [Mycolicibacterium sp. TUM20985]
MVLVNPGRETFRNVAMSIAIVAMTLATVWLAISFGKLALFGVIGILGLIVAAYVGIRHPLWFFYGLAAVMAGLQFGRIPGISLPIYLPLEFGCLVAAYFHPRLARSMHPLEFAVLALVITSGISVVATGVSLTSASLFIRWALPSLLLFALVSLSSEHLARFGRIFAFVSALNAVYGMYVVAFDPLNSSLRYLRVFGYSPEATAARFAFGAEGATQSVRLGGTWVEPNGAALNLVLALSLSVLLFAGWRRVLIAAVLAAGLALTLSRASIFTVVFGVLLVLVFHPMKVRSRAAMIGLIAFAAAAAMLAEPVRRRIMTSLSGEDAGSIARADALRAFPGLMSGHWGFGAGWARPEFIDPAFSYVFNLPSNAPLTALYRGGSLVLISFMAVVVIGCVVAYRSLRSNSTPRALYCGIFIGLCFVQMQLDHNVADLPQNVLLYSMFLAFVLYCERARIAERRAIGDEAESARVREAVTVRT